MNADTWWPAGACVRFGSAAALGMTLLGPIHPSSSLRRSKLLIMLVLIS
jgi:hypothetical protein